MAEGGDWDEVTYLRKKTPKAGEAKSKKVKRQIWWEKEWICRLLQAVTQAQRRGDSIETTKKCNLNSYVHSMNFSNNYYCILVDAGGNKQKSAAKDTAKLDRETEELKRQLAFLFLMHDVPGLLLSWCLWVYLSVHMWSSSDATVTLDFGRALQQARTAKGLTQKELATVSGCGLFDLPMILYFFAIQKINEKPQVVNEYESGKAIPNQTVISKMERALGMIIMWNYIID